MAVVMRTRHAIRAVDPARARAIWLAAQRLHNEAPFGSGPAATVAAVAHLGYVQIDTINVIERCHHHILFTRIPTYQRADLHHAQSIERSVFEYWTHALAYVPTADYRYFRPAMARHRSAPGPWYANIDPTERRALLTRIRRSGPLTMHDIDDGVRVEKFHAWASPKPAKRVLQWSFYTGDLTISERIGMLKRYERTDRHFGWSSPPKAAKPSEIVAYRVERALRSQGLVSLDSICHLEANQKSAVQKLIERHIRSGRLEAVSINGHPQTYWARPEVLDEDVAIDPERVHLLSPFDPLVIQRKRTAAFFGYAHLFEAYVPKAKRKLGYFALPVLIGDRIVAAIDLKTDRAAGRLMIQNWVWMPDARRRSDKPLIEAALHRFERFQLAVEETARAADSDRTDCATALK